MDRAKLPPDDADRRLNHHLRLYVQVPWEKTRFRTADPPEDDDPRLECGPDPWNFTHKLTGKVMMMHIQCSIRKKGLSMQNQTIRLQVVLIGFGHVTLSLDDILSPFFSSSSFWRQKCCNGKSIAHAEPNNSTSGCLNRVLATSPLALDDLLSPVRTT
ncbi:hypothetical protein CEXT_206971 [Caerostris extrusa]|uniref:Uncharacterized protein n=1 Tax=Caerostris extrusa TaxID=172846 RepID=A0AAV4Q0P4_CAEEX|nr:hypothetical protein CEXT_206971 [Caerostris extrusa]